MRAPKSLAAAALHLAFLGAASAPCRAAGSVSPSFQGSAGTTMSTGTIQVLISAPQAAASVASAGTQAVQSGFFTVLSAMTPSSPAVAASLAAFCGSITVSIRSTRRSPSL